MGVSGRFSFFSLILLAGNTSGDVGDYIDTKDISLKTAKCIDRESNPGRPRSALRVTSLKSGRRAFYH